MLAFDETSMQDDQRVTVDHAISELTLLIACWLIRRFNYVAQSHLGDLKHRRLIREMRF